MFFLDTDRESITDKGIQSVTPGWKVNHEM